MNQKKYDYVLLLWPYFNFTTFYVVRFKEEDKTHADQTVTREIESEKREKENERNGNCDKEKLMELNEKQSIAFHLHFIICNRYNFKIK